jgi:hypothetical protein
MNKIVPMKCAECGEDVAVLYQVADRTFNIEDGEIFEDLNDAFEPTFVFHCSADMEHDIEKNLTEEQGKQVLELKKKIVEEIINRFIEIPDNAVTLVPDEAA